MPINELAKIMCPVDDTGKYSVMPSTMPKTMDSKIVMGYGMLMYL